MRASVIAGAALGAVLLLSGCSETSPAAPSASPASATAVAAATTPSAAPSTPAPTPTASGASPVALKCGTLVPKAVLADVSKGYVRQKQYVPATDDVASQLVALGGTVCAYQNPQTGNTLEVAVAEPSAKSALALKNDLVDRSNSVPTYGEEGYFQTVEGYGVVDAFPGDYWVYARSNDFYEPGDASGVIAAATKALAKRG